MDELMAFPQPAVPKDSGPRFMEDHGMTLRDYFAAKALPSSIDGYREVARQAGWEEDWYSTVARDAYRIADAMLKVRSIK